MFSPARCLDTTGLVAILQMTLAADLKVEPLSETILCGKPRHTVKRLKDLRKE